MSVLDKSTVLRRRLLEFTQIADSTTLKILEFLHTQTNVKAIYDVPSKLGIPSTSFWRRIRSLRRKGIKFTVVLDEKRVGLSKIGFFLYDVYIPLESIPWKHWYNVHILSSIPSGTYILYYYPIMYGYRFIRDEIAKLSKREKTGFLTIDCTHVFLCQPRFTKYFDVERGKFKYLWKEWISEVKRILEDDNCVREEDECKHVFDVVCRDTPRDWIDLLILKELEIDAFQTFSEIAKHLHTRTWIIKYHYYRHILPEGIIKGIIPKLLYVDLTNAYTGAIIFRNRCIFGFRLKMFIDFLTQLPFVCAASLSSDLRTLSLQVAVPYDELIGFFRFRGFLRKYFDVVLEFNYHYRYFSRSTLPHTNYNPYTGVWVKEPSEVTEVLEGKLGEGGGS
ncbi:MAG TPA: hypothetical protein EYH40_03945 [Desulfurococcales archaeon]|nr:hypothetical protein [Desulfurococcales archaeon]